MVVVAAALSVTRPGGRAAAMAVLAGVALAAACRRRDRRALGRACRGRGVGERRDLGALAVAGRPGAALRPAAAASPPAWLCRRRRRPRSARPCAAPVSVVVVAVVRHGAPVGLRASRRGVSRRRGRGDPEVVQHRDGLRRRGAGQPGCAGGPVIALSATAVARMVSRGLNGVGASTERLPRSWPAARRASTTAGPATVANTGRRAVARTATRSSATASKPGGTSAGSTSPASIRSAVPRSSGTLPMRKNTADAAAVVTRAGGRRDPGPGLAPAASARDAG